MKEKIELGQIFCGEYSENCEVDRMSCAFSDCMAEVWAEKILSLGYHKTIWHKVAEGDLPKTKGVYICYYQCFEGRHCTTNVLSWDGEDFCGDEDMIKTIAWTELPIYKE